MFQDEFIFAGLSHSESQVFGLLSTRFLPTLLQAVSLADLRDLPLATITNGNLRRENNASSTDSSYIIIIVILLYILYIFYIYTLFFNFGHSLKFHN